MKSPSMSMKGWDFSKWFIGNWKTVKELLKVGVPLMISVWAVSNPALVAVFTIVGKLLLDTGEYYFKEVMN